MSLYEDFYRKERYIGNRRLRKVNESAYRLWRNRVIKFLEFCDRQHIFFIKDIRQSHYDNFIAHITNSRSAATMRDWKYALDYFFKRSHLQIKVQTSFNKQIEKRKFTAYVRLRSELGEKQAKKIMAILNGLF